MPTQANFMVDHDKIRRWVEERGGQPATIGGTAKKGEEAGLLRIDFPGGAKNPPLEPISWEAFFEKFDEANLALIYQDDEGEEEKNVFCKFVSRETVEEKESSGKKPR
jgi:hypothetical protein